MKYATLAGPMMHKTVNLKHVETECVTDCMVARKKGVWDKVGGSDAGQGTRSGGSGRIERHSDYCDSFRLWQYVAAFIAELRKRASGRGISMMIVFI